MGRARTRHRITWRAAIPAAVAITLLVAACSSGGNGSAGPNGTVDLVMWMGYTPPPPVSQSAEYLSLKHIVADFTKLHPKIHIHLEYVNNDYALQKATVALQGGQQPDISYQYGTNMPQLAQTPQVVNLTTIMKQPQYGWSDFFVGERDVATVDGKALGMPALVDNLAVVYNKTLFAQHHLAPPTPSWTWSQLAADAKAITNPSQKIFGLTFPADGSETTVWEYEAMLWEAGGSILTPGNTKAAFNSAAGVQALTTLRQMQQAHSLYLDFHPDAGKSEELFNSGKLGMIITGPWDLSSFPNAHYGVQIMPSFSPGGSHQSISGPDNWVIFNNGPARVKASLEFLRYLTSPPVLLANSLATGDLPTKASVLKMPGFAQFDQKYPGEGVFAQNLSNVHQARPQIAQYPRVSAALGQAVVAALLGQATPQAALNSAAQQADTYLTTSGG
jgi:multiple sugar transport system substrate-binding protein